MKDLNATARLEVEEMVEEKKTIVPNGGNSKSTKHL